MELQGQGQRLKVINADLHEVRDPLHMHGECWLPHKERQTEPIRYCPCMARTKLYWVQIDADVKEAKGILAYMRRCCLCFLFSCCCDCDPSKKADETRQQRVDM